MALVDAIRSTVTSPRVSTRLARALGDPALDEDELDVPLTPELQARIPASVLGVHVEGETLADVLPRLREVYCGTIAYEIEHRSDHAERTWLRSAIESGRFRRLPPAEERRALLERLAQVEGFETPAQASSGRSSLDRGWTCRPRPTRWPSRSRGGAHEVDRIEHRAG
jgi:hypothetical protein